MPFFESPPPSPSESTSLTYVFASCKVKHKLISAFHNLKFLNHHVWFVKNSSIFFQCPHESICPRQIEKKHPCSFTVRFRNFPFNGLSNGQNDTVFTGKYSYIVAQKGNIRIILFFYDTPFYIYCLIRLLENYRYHISFIKAFLLLEHGNWRGPLSLMFFGGNP